MPTILCRVVWAADYLSDQEYFFAGNMKYPKKKGDAHELQNFLNVNGTVYGFVENNGDWIKISNLGAASEDSEIDGITVIWCALDETTRRLRVVGWYDDARVFAEPQTRKASGGSRTYQFTASAGNAHPIPVAERSLEVPMRKRVTDRGYIGQRNWFFPETSDRYDKFLEAFAELRSTPTSLTPSDQDTESFQEGQRFIAEVKFATRNPGLVNAAKRKYGYRCQVCDFSFEERYGLHGKGFIEVHHLQPLADSKVGRTSTVDEVRVLCANCHRMVHREKGKAMDLEELRKLLREP